MTFVSYAQNFEDVLLWRALHDIENGIYLDIGAQDPVIDSVSLAFYQAGWRGMHVEPTPTYAEKLRSARPDETVIQAAVCEFGEPLQFFEFPGTGLSTGKAAIAERHATAGFARREIIVPSIKLEKLLGMEPGDYQWVKIDVEGMEAEVLRSWGSSDRRPWIFVVEATAPLSQEPTHDIWIEELLSRGYREVHFDGLSRYFLHEAQAHRGKAFETGANVFDRFSITRGHFSAFALKDELDACEARVVEQDVHKADIEARLHHAQDELVEDRQKIDDLLARLSEAEAKRDDALAQQVETYNARLLDQSAHQQRLEALWRERVEIETNHRRETQSLETKHRSETESLENAHRRELKALEGTLQRKTDRIESAHLGELERLKAEFALSERSSRERFDDQQRQRDGQLQHLQNARNSLQEERAELRERLARAGVLIESALAVPASRWDRLRGSLGFARKDVVKDILLRFESRSDPGLNPANPVISSLAEVKLNGSPNSLSELLSLDGDDFVQAAYVAVLGREADPDGEEYYCRRLDAGIPKLQILNQMRRSNEGRALVDSMAGLGEALRRFRFRSLFQGKKKAASSIESHVISQRGLATIQQFMQYHDEQFVRTVYRYYTNTDPDDVLSNLYCREIRSGINKQKILVDIAKLPLSKEIGRRAKGQLGVEIAIAIENIPILGTIITAIKFNLRIKAYLQDVRSLQNHVYRLSNKIGS